KCVTGPTAPAACASNASRAAGSARSPTHGTASSGRGDALIAAVTVSGFTSANTVRTPSPTSACAIARPIPLPAPVTSAASRAGSKGVSKMLMTAAPEGVASGPQSAINCGLAQPVSARNALQQNGADPPCPPHTYPDIRKWTRSGSGPRRPLPDDVRHVDRFRNKAELRKTVGNRLLALYGLIIDRHDAVAGARDEAFDRVDIDTGRLGLRLRHLVVVAVRPPSLRGKDGVELRYQRRMLVHEVRSRDIERIGLVHVLVENDDPRILLQLGERQVGIPDRPRIDRALEEGCRRIGRRERRRRNIAIGKAGLLQRRDQQIMRARSLAEGDTLAFEVGDRLDRRVLGND